MLRLPDERLSEIDHGFHDYCEMTLDSSDDRIFLLAEWEEGNFTKTKPS
jgi:hypothetical protein